MALPDFNAVGDLPEGVHQAALAEVVARFGTGTAQRQEVAARLLRIHELAEGTDAFDRLILFGSFITDKPDPNDVNVVLVMRDDFRLTGCTPDALALFDHARSAEEFGASIFWVRPGMLFLESLETFIAHWQVKRDRTRRGIVEVKR